MHATFAIVGALASAAFASPMPQGVTENIKPDASAPDGCSASYSGNFEITAVNSTVKRDLSKRACNADGSLTLSLADGVLKDAQSRTGYIADNFQFQFDGPPQAGAIYTGGFSVCNNGSLALGGSAIFYQCLSGTFYNLYDRHWAAQCDPILITVLPCSGSSGSVGQGSDGQPTGNVGQIGDGQPTGTGAAIPPVTQISDGQIQGSTAIPVSELPDGQPNVPTGLVSQISDGQIQNPTAAPGPVVTQIGDGQPQAPTGAPITQIGDGQPQAPTAVPTPITQIGDGQVQAPTGAPITQIPDGQIQAPNATVSKPTPAPTDIAGSGAGMNMVGSSLAFALAGLGAILLL